MQPDPVYQAKYDSMSRYEIRPRRVGTDAYGHAFLEGQILGTSVCRQATRAKAFDWE